MVKCDINVHNFRHNGSNSIKVTFSIDFIKTFRAIYILFGSAEVRILPLLSIVSIVFVNDIIMTSFLVTWFSNLHITWNVE